MKTKLLRILLILSISVIAITSFSQTWTKTFGDQYDDEAYTVHQTFDGGYIITGSITSDIWNADVCLIRTNGSGETLWIKTYGGINNDAGIDVKQTADNGFILSGYTTSYGAGGYDVWLIKTNSIGDSLWSKTFGGTNNEFGNSVIQTADNGYVVIGSTESYGSGSSDFWMIKTNSVGDSLWSKTYGGNYNDIAFSGEQTSDDGFVLTGYTQPAGFNNADVWLIKTDHLGEMEWSQTYGGNQNELANSVQQTYDEGYIITGYTNSFGAGAQDVYLIKTDMFGDTIWTKTFGGASNDVGNFVIQTAESDFIVCGFNFSLSPNGDPDLWLIKTDISGDTLWTRTYGGSGSEVGRFVEETFDGGLIVSGWTSSYGAGQKDIWLLHTDQDGTVGFADHESWNSIGYKLNQNYPNPFSGATTIAYFIPYSENVTLKIYDLSGRHIITLVDEFQQSGNHSARFEDNQLKEGIYYYRMQSGTFDCTKKLIISQ
ncbi:MAG: T9SS type A sorting domain-containing protein [Bacteroidales bacterium]|nr:T9SS type A sorting domain-containing protein [Bacteroidales bacterium]